MISPASPASVRLFIVLLLLGLSGCQNLPDTERPQLTEPFVVTRDMPGEELVTHLGEPDLKYPLHDYSVDAEVWVYNRTLQSKSKMVITGTEVVHLWDPVTRSTISIDMPVYRPETAATVEVSEILMIRDKVYSWKRKTLNDRQVDGVTR